MNEGILENTIIRTEHRLSRLEIFTLINTMVLIVLILGSPSANYILLAVLKIFGIA